MTAETSAAEGFTVLFDRLRSPQDDFTGPSLILGADAFEAFVSADDASFDVTNLGTGFVGVDVDAMEVSNVDRGFEDRAGSEGPGATGSGLGVSGPHSVGAHGTSVFEAGIGLTDVTAADADIADKGDSASTAFSGVVTAKVD